MTIKTLKQSDPHKLNNTVPELKFSVYEIQKTTK